MVDSYTISYSNLDCSDDVYDPVTGIDDGETMYRLTDLQEGTEYSITVTAMLTGGNTERDTEFGTTTTIG